MCFNKFVADKTILLFFYQACALGIVHVLRVVMSLKYVQQLKIITDVITDKHPYPFIDYVKN